MSRIGLTVAVASIRRGEARPCMISHPNRRRVELRAPEFLPSKNSILTTPPPPIIYVASWCIPIPHPIPSRRWTSAPPLHYR